MDKLVVSSDDVASVADTLSSPLVSPRLSPALPITPRVLLAPLVLVLPLLILAFT